MSVSGTFNDDWAVYRNRYSYKSAGNMSLDPNGNIVGTTDTGGSFLWLRK